MPLRLFKRGAVWYVRGSVAGHGVYESLRTDCEATARELRDRTEAALWHRHIHGEPAALTVAEAILLYLEAGGEARFLQPILEAWHDRKVAEIRSGHVQDLARRLYPQAAPATWNRQVVTPLSAVINCAVERDQAKPVRLKRFKVAEAQRVAVDRAWIDAFRAACRSPYLAALALLMFQTGARLGEAVGLRPRDLDLMHKRAHIPVTKSGNPHTYHLTLELTVELANLPPRRGRVLGYKSRSSVYGPWQTACRRADLPYVPPHQAGRHSFATELIVRGGVDVATTAKLGNWKSRRLLLDRYVHTQADASVVEAHFGEGGAGRRERKA